MSSTILGALFFFQEITWLPTSHIVFFSIGVIIAVFGILLHSTRASQLPNVQHDEVGSDYVHVDNNATIVTPVKEAMEVMEEYGTEHCGGPILATVATDVGNDANSSSFGGSSKKRPLLV